MATYLEIDTINADRFNVKLNQLANLPEFEKEEVSFRKSQICYIVLTLNDASIEMYVETLVEMQLSFNGANNTIPVEAVNGVNPTSNKHLYDLLNQL